MLDINQLINKVKILNNKKRKIKINDEQYSDKFYQQISNLIRLNINSFSKKTTL
jgi:hypothetical protein